MGAHGDREPPLVELVIDSLAAGGDGVGRTADGRVVFVPLAAPGDRVRVRLVEEKPRFARGEIEALLAPGAARVAPRCPVFGVCGGCAWQHVDYGAQVEAKRRIVRDALARIAGLAELPPLDFTPSPAPYGYRGRARVRVERGAVGFRQRRSHELCAVTGCPLLAPPLDAALAALAAAPPKPAGEWELALGANGAVRVAPLTERARARGDRARGGEERLPLRAGGERLELSPGVFAQANALLLDVLAESVLDAAGHGTTALELFAGAGFFTLGLARRFERVIAVESDPDATRDLARNVAAAAGGGPRRVRVVEARVEPWLAAGEALALAPEVVVLDPPRGGVGAAAAEALAALPARRLVHLSCDPATLARDVAVLTAGGWRLASLRGFDLFPHTPHVETLAVLEPRDATLGPSPSPSVALRPPAAEARTVAASSPVESSFVLYVEGPRDRGLLEAWAFGVSPPLARALPAVTVILGGCQPLRAAEHFRGVRARRRHARGLCVLDRDIEQRPPPERAQEPGLEFFTWSRRHIESYLLVPDAICRVARVAPDEPRIARWFERELPAPEDEGSFTELDAKGLFAHHGGLQQLLGRPIRPAHVARAMRPDELHHDVHALLGRLRDVLGLREPASAGRRPLRSV